MFFHKTHIACAHLSSLVSEAKIFNLRRSLPELNVNAALHMFDLRRESTNWNLTSTTCTRFGGIFYLVSILWLRIKSESREIAQEDWFKRSCWALKVAEQNKLLLLSLLLLLIASCEPTNWPKERKRESEARFLLPVELAHFFPACLRYNYLNRVGRESSKLLLLLLVRLGSNRTEPNWTDSNRLKASFVADACGHHSRKVTFEDLVVELAQSCSLSRFKLCSPTKYLNYISCCLKMGTKPATPTENNP